MSTLDYDKALYYMNRLQLDDLLVLMIRTNDDFLSKKIERYLHALYYETDYQLVERQQDSLYHYLDNAYLSFGFKEIPVYS
ncbi:YhdB family protein [Aureibacillus halotolerans]|uniref:YhdB-like protein n=1 Tax=Aureibacillus halotolerans TaxID=1508390 RepID=A0A4R6TR17_9BACI|nr:YhdB family protein [Aureibacillus halotolerans]TDQ35421.1 YhdB-like protein [Aureibacillus halotolerans]